MGYNMRLLAPSHANQWMKCLRFEGEQQTSDTEAAKEGIAAAWLADTVLTSPDGIRCDDFENETAPNGWLITSDMVKHIQGYIDYILAESHGKGFASEVSFTDAETGISGRVDNLLYHPDVPELWKLLI